MSNLYGLRLSKEYPSTKELGTRWYGAGGGCECQPEEEDDE